MQSKSPHPLLNYFFPRLCIGCNTPGVYICATCSKRIGECSTQKCYKCHKPSPYGLVHWGCKTHSSLLGVFSLFLYRGVGGRVIKYAKYRRQQEVVSDLFSCISHTTQSQLYDFIVYSKPNVFIPVPLHKNTLNMRGFNQSARFSQNITQLFGVPTASIFEKLSEREPQSKMSQSMRVKNVRGAYRINPRNTTLLKEKTVCIVDDVITTGATLEDLLRLLRPLSKRVFGITLLRSFK